MTEPCGTTTAAGIRGALSMTFEERVQLNEDKLNDTDDQIVEYIRKNREEIGDISIQAMAKVLYTVPNTIVRFAKKLGYRGFAEMKAALALENRRAEEDPHLPVTGIIQKNLGTVGFRADSPGGAENAPGQAGVFLRGGRFRPFLRDDGEIFAVCRQTGRFFTQRHEMLYQADRCSDRDLVFVISASGETRQVLEAVAAAKQKGTYVISLTHLSRNPLAEMADFRLYCWAPKRC